MEEKREVFLIHQMDSGWMDISACCDKYFILDSMQDLSEVGLLISNHEKGKSTHNKLPAAIAEFKNVTELVEYLEKNDMHINYEGFYCYDGSFTLSVKEV